MIEIEIPEDIRKYEAKFVGPFTLRQAVCFAAGCVLAVPTYLIISKFAPTDVAAFACIIVSAPFLVCGWVQPYGMTMEQFAKTAFVSNILAPTKRKYKTVNLYELAYNLDDETPKKKIKRLKKIPKSKNKDLQSYF